MFSLWELSPFIVLAIASVNSDLVHQPPVVAAPAIGYARTIPYNVPPYAASVNIFSRLLQPAPILPPLVQAAPPLPNLAPVLPNVAPFLPPPYPQAHSIHPPSLIPNPYFGIPRALPVPYPAHPVPAPALPIPAPGVAVPGPALPVPGHAFGIPQNILPYSFPGLATPFGIPPLLPSGYAQPLWRR